MSLAAVGILGGTFDPIHHGHLRLAQEAFEQCELLSVHFVPAGTPPHREAPAAGIDDRLEMTRLAIQDNPHFVLNEIEAKRSGPCYMVETLNGLRAEFGPQQPLALLLGGDAFLGLSSWHLWRQLFDLAHLIVVQRAGFPLGNAMEKADAGLLAEYRARLAPSARALREAACGSILVIDMPALEISASGIRSRIREHKDPRYLLPPSVIQYIQSRHLYADH
jgi:nicotinate-nucleotide adenylyltransferase